MKKLHINNFGPVKDAKVVINRFNLFIGEQSVGKSTIAKLITIFTDILNVGFLSSKDTRDNTWISCLKNYDLQPCIFSDNYGVKSYSVEYDEVEEDLEIHIELNSLGSKSQVIYKGKEYTASNDIIPIMMNKKKIYHEDQLSFDPHNVSTDDLAKHIINNFRNSLYVPAERIIGSLSFRLLPAIMMIKEQIPNNLLKFILELNNARSKYQEFPVEMLNVTYKVENETDFVVLSDGKPIPLKNASSGMQSLIPLLLVLMYGKENAQYESFVIEEPECNLFPDKQRQFLEKLISEIFVENRSITITTHSPYLLSALNNYLFAGYISEEMSEDANQELSKIVAKSLWIHTKDCSIYSLGEEINDGVYCKSIVDDETGLIDFNYLDGVSMTMGDDFSRMQRLYVREKRKSN